MNMITLTLVCLVSSTRAHEMSSLNTDFLVKHSAHYSFHFLKIRKTVRQGKLRLSDELTQFSDKNLWQI